jgi:hypothetical protein
MTAGFDEYNTADAHFVPAKVSGGAGDGDGDGLST